ncbi:type IV secretion system protein [Caballeronia sp. DA-9]|uniref:type IV secretion system protein n=1 Tax=Caballeronia sp. DA-9 TaxID=3436237 RepID=UPI003F679365
MSGLFTSIGGTLENGTATYVTSTSAALSSALVPVVTTSVTIWIITYGLAVIRGESHEAVPAFAWRGLKVALILAFALGSGIYQSQVISAVNGATTGLAQTIQNAAASNGAGNPGCGAVNASAVSGGTAGGSDTGIYQTLDCYDQQVALVAGAYFKKAAHESVGFSMIGASIGDLICGVVAAIGGAIFLIVLGVEVVMARMLLDLVLGLGPIFIACAAFAPSARFFEAWTAKVANYALLQVLVAAFLGMALSAFSADLTTLGVTGSSPATNAAALEAQVQTTLDGASDIATALGLFMTAVFLTMVGWQLPAVASGLAGGATLSGFGSFMAGVASRSFVDSLGKALRGARGGRGGQPGGTIDNASGRSGGAGGNGSAGSIPAYQRAARDHLGRDGG